MDVQLVCRDDGHRNCRSTHELGAFSNSGSLLFVDRVLSAQCGDILTGIDHLHPSIHSLSGNLASDDPRPDQLALLGNHPDGVCDTHRDVGLHMCSTMGAVGHVCGVGAMDGGRCCGGFSHSFSIIHLVSPSSENGTCKNPC